MSDKYTLKEVHVEVLPGVTLTADVSNLDGLITLLSDLRSKNLTGSEAKKQQDQLHMEQKKEVRNDTPSGRMEVNAGIEKGSLAAKNILAFKNEIPQLLRPSAFANVTDAALILLHAVEVGLKSPATDYDSFKGLYEAQNLKSGTPLSMLMTNLRKTGYLDKKSYNEGRKLRLTLKGERKAIQIIKEMISPK